MQNENKKNRFSGKGYYIALMACIAAVGISGYVFATTLQDSAVEVSGEVSSMESPSPDTAAVPEAKITPSAETKTDRMEDAYEETVQEIFWPIEGQVLAAFSRDTLTYSQTMADWRTHEGLDISAEAGALVAATEDGTVTAVYDDDFLGTVVVVTHSGDLATLYANLAETPSVAVGDSVHGGQILGQVGSTALLETADPTHLHFEVYENGIPVDPMAYLPE